MRHIPCRSWRFGEGHFGSPATVALPRGLTVGWGGMQTEARGQSGQGRWRGMYGSAGNHLAQRSPATRCPRYRRIGFAEIFLGQQHSHRDRHSADRNRNREDVTPRQPIQDPDVDSIQAEAVVTLGDQRLRLCKRVTGLLVRGTQVAGAVPRQRGMMCAATASFKGPRSCLG